MKASQWRQWRASLRDTWLLLNEFRTPLFLFTIAVLGIGLFYDGRARLVHEATGSLAESIYLVLSLAFFQPAGDFPDDVFLQIVFFIMPIIGLSTLASGLADFGMLIFNRKLRNKEWEMAVASTFNNHTILVGLGHLGYRVVQNLHAMDEPVVAIELNPSADLVQTVQAMGIPVIQDDATREAALQAAGITRARTIVMCSQNDALNLQIAVRARNLKPDIRVVVRIFDDDFAESLQKQFGFLAMSATSMAAPAFAAAAGGADVTRPITVENESLSLARLALEPDSKLIGKTICQVEDRYDLNVVLLKRKGQPDVQPANDRVLEKHDTLAVLGNPQQISLLVHDSHA